MFRSNGFDFKYDLEPPMALRLNFLYDMSRWGNLKLCNFAFGAEAFSLVASWGPFTQIRKLDVFGYLYMPQFAYVQSSRVYV